MNISNSIKSTKISNSLNSKIVDLAPIIYASAYRIGVIPDLSILNYFSSLSITELRPRYSFLNYDLYHTMDLSNRLKIRIRKEMSEIDSLEVKYILYVTYCDLTDIHDEIEKMYGN